MGALSPNQLTQEPVVRVGAKLRTMLTDTWLRLEDDNRVFTAVVIALGTLPCLLVLLAVLTS
jgi:hypothetical protein